jgi:argininosuccinate synthase
MNDVHRIVMAFSGGADAAEAVRALSAEWEVVTLTLDVGQGHELTGVRERALACGAVRAHVLDVRDELANDLFWPAVRAKRPLSAAGEILAPLVAAKLVELARIEGAAAVAHEWSGEDAERLARIVGGIDAALIVLAPLAGARHSASDEPTLWCSARLSGSTPFELTRDAAGAPDEGAIVDIAFRDGVPERLNGIEMSLVESIESLETLAGAHGIGRVPLADDAWVEAPAAVVLEKALEALTAFCAGSSSEHLDGTVSLRLRRGACSVISCTAVESRLAAERS